MNRPQKHCEFCNTMEQGITLDGKSKYIIHELNCLLLTNNTSTGRETIIK